MFVVMFYIDLSLLPYTFYNGEKTTDCSDRDLNNLFSHIRNETGHITNFLLKDNL